MSGTTPGRKLFALADLEMIDSVICGRRPAAFLAHAPRSGDFDAALRKSEQNQGIIVRFLFQAARPTVG